MKNKTTLQNNCDLLAYPSSYICCFQKNIQNMPRRIPYPYFQMTISFFFISQCKTEEQNNFTKKKKKLWLSRKIYYGFSNLPPTGHFTAK